MDIRKATAVCGQEVFDLLQSTQPNVPWYIQEHKEPRFPYEGWPPFAMIWPDDPRCRTDAVEDEDPPVLPCLYVAATGNICWSDEHLEYRRQNDGKVMPAWRLDQGLKLFLERVRAYRDERTAAGLPANIHATYPRRAA